MDYQRLLLQSHLLDKNSKKMYHNIISSVSAIIYNSRIELQDAFYTPDEIVLVLEDTDAARHMNY